MRLSAPHEAHPNRAEVRRRLRYLPVGLGMADKLPLREYQRDASA
jgi:hypothetical protein